MIHSMTGFGRASFSRAGVRFDLEVRSVNHRYLDVRVRLPRVLASLEPEVRARVQDRLARGKVDVVIASPEGSSPRPRLEIDLEAAREYLRAAAQLRDSDGVGGQLDVARLLALPGVAGFQEPELLDDDLRRDFAAALDAALAAAIEMRAAEGEALARDLELRLQSVSALADALEERRESVAQQVRERLERRTAQIARDTGLYDEARLHQELVIAVDRMDVTEELVRLRSHVEQLRKALRVAGPGQPVGRRLDFLLQEFGREANTIGSKAGDAGLAHHVVELKGEIERIREQVQNIE